MEPAGPETVAEIWLSQLDLTGPFDVLALNLSLIGHFRPMATGSVFVSDIGYFVSGTLLALFLTTRRMVER